LFGFWHREFLHRFEQALQSINPNVALPYWDISLEGDALPTRFQQELASVIHVRDVMRQSGRRIQRYAGNSTTRNTNFTSSSQVTLRKNIIKGYNAALKLANWSSFFSSIGVESPHNSVHGYVGGAYGDMGDPFFSSFDPIFWSHHCNVDRVLQKYLDNQTDTTREDIFNYFKTKTYPLWGTLDENIMRNVGVTYGDTLPPTRRSVTETNPASLTEEALRFLVITFTTLRETALIQTKHKATNDILFTSMTFISTEPEEPIKNPSHHNHYVTVHLIPRSLRIRDIDVLVNNVPWKGGMHLSLSNFHVSIPKL
jgi:hypothetical protein